MTCFNNISITQPLTMFYCVTKMFENLLGKHASIAFQSFYVEFLETEKCFLDGFLKTIRCLYDPSEMLNNMFTSASRMFKQCCINAVCNTIKMVDADSLQIRKRSAMNSVT